MKYILVDFIRIFYLGNTMCQYWFYLLYTRLAINYLTYAKSQRNLSITTEIRFQEHEKWSHVKSIYYQSIKILSLLLRRSECKFLSTTFLIKATQQGPRQLLYLQIVSNRYRRCRVYSEPSTLCNCRYLTISNETEKIWLFSTS